MQPDGATGPTSGVARRSLLRGLVAAGVAAGAAPGVGMSARAAGPVSGVGDWAAFDQMVRSAFDRMKLVGAAVAVVSCGQVLHTLTLGSRSVQPRRLITEDTYFRVGSTTKGMTSALIATYVDQGKLAWDQPVVDAWSRFRAPTDALTRSLRVRDLLGMASGLGEPPSGGDLHLGGPTAAALVQGVPSLPVIGATGSQFYYNNSVNAVGGYLPLLASGVAPDDLAPAYAQAMHDRVFAPAGMTGALLGDDPRGLVDDYATGNEFDLAAKARPLFPFGSIGAHAPAGATLATLRDMAAWVRLQLRHGVSVDGRRVVSAANLAECWKGGVPTPFSPNVDPDAVGEQYGMGWHRKEFTNGTTLVWHDGAIEGFTSYVGFLPQHDLGLVVLNNINFSPSGIGLYTYTVNLLLNHFGLNLGTPARALAFSDSGLDSLRRLGRQARPVDWRAVAPHLGYYADGYSLMREGQELRLRVMSRQMPLAAMPDGTYVVSGGLIIETPVKLGHDLDGVPHIEIVGQQTVRRVAGLE